MIQANKKKYFIGALCGIIASSLLSFSSAKDPLEQIIVGFGLFLSEMPQEKVYLHLDRPNYAAGESIWFKAYLTAGPFHEVSLLSRTIYVELINDQGNIINLIKVFSPDGLAAGQLQLPDSLSSGNYLLRAYTNWMRNSDEEYFFHKQLKIWGDSNSTLAESESGNLDIQFFPEGGNLVNGILSKVAFKAIGENGLGIPVKGKILVESQVITEFESNQLGMGIFPLLPEKGKRYKALIEGRELELPLPDSFDSGIVMSVTNSPKSPDIIIKIQSSENSTIQTIQLLAQTRGLVCATILADLSKKVVFARIPKKEFPSGIAQIIALDENGIPLAERLVFIDQQDQIFISVSPVKSVYSPRDSLRLDIEAKNKDGKPVVANLSLSVFDSEQVLVDENKENIQSNLLISSELKGHIESPGYYFNPKNQDRVESLDFLMLTQGWRKFTVKEALSGNIPIPVYRVEKGLTISGVLLDQKNNQPEVGGSVSYLSLFPIPDSKTAITNSKGEFEIHDLVFFDSTKVVLQGKTEKGRTSVPLVTDSAFQSPRLSHPIVSDFSIPSVLEENFLIKSKERRNIEKAYDFENSDFALEGVEVQGKRIVEQYSGPRIYGNGTTMVKVAGNTGLENLQHPLDLVKGRVAGVQVTGSGQNWTVLIQGVGSINSSIEPLIMVDDIPIRLESLHTFPVQEIESFTVWKGPDTAIFGARGANGAIGFYTKKKNENSSKTTGNADFPGLSGYQLEREFYSPEYLPQDPSSNPDRRATLFWAPYIQTDSLGKASVLFYNHDLETVIQGEIEGISIHGNPGTARFHYRIVKE